MKLILRQGFTLIELMIAILVVAILSVISVSLYRTQLMKQQIIQLTTIITLLH